MTRRISLVAVCRSSASFVSLNSRTFSMAITAWFAKVLEQRDLLLRKRSRFGVSDGYGSDGLPLMQHRHGDDAPKARKRSDDIFGVLFNVRNVDDAPCQDRPATAPPRLGGMGNKLRAVAAASGLTFASAAR